MIRRAALLVLLLWSGRAAAQTPTIRIDDAGPGVGPRLLARALAAPHTVVSPAGDRFVVARTADLRGPLIVLGRDVVVEGRVAGDLIVVAGDLYLHPGGVIGGAAVSIGGGVYESSLGTIAGPVRSFRDFTYDIQPISDGFALRYRALGPRAEAGLSFPGIAGATLPTYDRTNGVSLGFSPRYSPAGAPLVVVPQATYRSQLGQVDPSLEVEFDLERRTTLAATVGRETRSNDRWIHSDFVNGAIFFLHGDDTRNYYRATAAEARLQRSWESEIGAVVPYVAVGVERARSVRPDSLATGGPWTLFERNDSERLDRLRPNPEIDAGTIASVTGGASGRWSTSGVTADARLDLEAGSLSPSAGLSRRSFGQLTFDGGISFPTFGSQFIEIAGHIVSTAGRAPRQRWAYVGGSGTVTTLDLLSEGGDELLYFEGTYQVPMGRIQVPWLGPPIVGLREVLGGAAVGIAPTVRQAIGIRVSLERLYAEVMLDPTTRRSRTGVGIAFGR